VDGVSGSPPGLRLETRAKANSEPRTQGKIRAESADRAMVRPSVSGPAGWIGGCQLRAAEGPNSERGRLQVENGDGCRCHVPVTCRSRVTARMSYQCGGRRPSLGVQGSARTGLRRGGWALRFRCPCSRKYRACCERVSMSYLHVAPRRSDFLSDHSCLPAPVKLSARL
jgi:hypothetical protein